MVTNTKATLILTPDMDRESIDGRMAMNIEETLTVSLRKCF
jgi:hypothetical protein